MRGCESFVSELYSVRKDRTGESVFEVFSCLHYQNNNDGHYISFVTPKVLDKIDTGKFMSAFFEWDV